MKIIIKKILPKKMKKFSNEILRLNEFKPEFMHMENYEKYWKMRQSEKDELNENVDIILTAKGGEGAVRELVDLLLRYKK